MYLQHNYHFVIIDVFVFASKQFVVIMHFMLLSLGGVRMLGKKWKHLLKREVHVFVLICKLFVIIIITIIIRVRIIMTL